MNFRKHYFFYTLLVLAILMISASYYRFMIINDYLIRYESSCDPTSNICYEGCVDDECTEVYFYKKITRPHNTLKELCGDNIDNCTEANYCPLGEQDCSVTYCDSILESGLCESYESNTGEGAKLNLQRVSE